MNGELWQFKLYRDFSPVHNQFEVLPNDRIHANVSLPGLFGCVAFPGQFSTVAMYTDDDNKDH